MTSLGATPMAANLHIFEGLTELDPVTLTPYLALAASEPKAVDDMTYEVARRDGATGHLEGLAAGPAVTAAYARQGGDAATDTPGIVAAAATGEELASVVLTTAAEAAGEALTGFANALDPEVCVISGGLSAAGSLWWELMLAARIMAQVAASGVLGGAVAVQVQGLANIQATRSAVELPVIGLFKDGHDDVFITPTVHYALAVAQVGAHIWR